MKSRINKRSDVLLATNEEQFRQALRGLLRVIETYCSPTVRQISLSEVQKAREALGIAVQQEQKPCEGR